MDITGRHIAIAWTATIMGVCALRYGFWPAFAALIAGCWAVDEFRWTIGASIHRWVALIGTQTRNLIAGRKDLAAPDGSTATITAVKKIDDGVELEVWAGSSMDALSDYVNGQLVGDLNRANRARVRRNPQRWAVQAATLQHVRDTPGVGRVLVMRTHPIAKTWEWPYEPGVTPMANVFDSMDWGRSAWGADVRFPLWADAGHFLGAGSTGTGKSSGAHVILSNVLPLNLNPAGPRVVTIGIDCKGGVEFGDWGDAFSAYATSPAEGIRLLKRVDRFLGPDGPRMAELASMGRRKLTADIIGPDMPAVLILVDELAVLMAEPEGPALFARLASLIRAGGGRIGAFTQYPTDRVIPSEISVNFDFRACWRIGTLPQARVALQDHGELSSTFGPHATILDKDPRWAGANFVVTPESGLTLNKGLFVDEATSKANAAACAVGPILRPDWLLSDPKPASRPKRAGGTTTVQSAA